MAGFQKILVGVDLHQGDRLASGELSPETQAAIQQALELAIHAGGTVSFCAALDVSPQTESLIEQDHQKSLRTVEDVASELLDNVVATAAGRGVTADKIVRLGAPADELARTASTGKYDLIVVGTRRQNSATRLLFGSTSQKLIRAAPCAVWVVKPEEVREIREIAVATDLTESSIPVLRSAIDAARALAAKLYIVHVVDVGQLSYLLVAGIPGEEIAAARVRLRDEAEARLNQQLSMTDFRTLPHGILVEVLEGSPNEVITKFIVDREVDILVVGSHGRRGISRLVLGSTVERLLPEIHCSAIVVKPDDFVSPYASAAAADRDKT
jgi:universal stress protein E